MRRNSAETPVCVLFVLALICLSCCPEISLAQGGPPPQPGYASPGPDQMIYFRPGPKERWVGITITNTNFPGLPYYLHYLRQTTSMLENIGYRVANNPPRAAIQVHVTARYSLVASGQASPPRAGAPGGILGAVTGLLFGVGGPGPAEPASPPPMSTILTLEFDISSRVAGMQFGRVTRDITGLPVGPEQYIDAAIADYLQVALPRRR